MANQGITLNYDKAKVKRFEKLLRDKEAKIKNFSYPMRKIALVMHKSTMANFMQEGRPQRWKALKDSTRIARRKGGGSGISKVLQDTGTLRQSIASVSDRYQAKVGTNLVYAKIHQFGHRTKKIPARPFLRMQDSETPMIEKMIVDYLT